MFTHGCYFTAALTSTAFLGEAPWRGSDGQNPAPTELWRQISACSLYPKVGTNSLNPVALQRRIKNTWKCTLNGWLLEYRGAYPKQRRICPAMHDSAIWPFSDLLKRTNKAWMNIQVIIPWKSVLLVGWFIWNQSRESQDFTRRSFIAGSLLPVTLAIITKASFLSFLNNDYLMKDRETSFTPSIFDKRGKREAVAWVEGLRKWDRVSGNPTSRNHQRSQTLIYHFIVTYRGALCLIPVEAWCRWRKGLGGRNNITAGESSTPVKVNDDWFAEPSFACSARILFRLPISAQAASIVFEIRCSGKAGQKLCKSVEQFCLQKEIEASADLNLL